MSRLLAFAKGLLLGFVMTGIEITIASEEPQIVAEDSVDVREMR